MGLFRVTGAGLQTTWTRGEMLKSVNLLLRAAKREGYVVPVTLRLALPHSMMIIQ